MELAAAMACFSSVVIILFVVCPTARCNGVTSSTFMMTKDKQLPSDACQEVGGSRRMSRAQCAGACGVTAGCQGFSFTCADLHLGSSCRCFVCFAADLGAASTMLEATSGVMTSQTVLPLTTTAPPTTTLQLPCSPPPLIDRTTVTHTVTPTHDTAHYSCSVSTDVLVRGTVDVDCANGASWPVATILCAPTTCWTIHPTWGPVYAGTVAVTLFGSKCQAWNVNTPQVKSKIYELDSSYPSDKDKTAASNYCRIFDDDYSNPWCYLNDASKGLWADCNVPHCPVVPGQRLP